MPQSAQTLAIGEEMRERARAFEELKQEALTELFSHDEIAAKRFADWYPKQSPWLRQQIAEIVKPKRSPAWRDYLPGAREVLRYLNQKRRELNLGGRGFRELDSTLRPIAQILKTGVSVSECKAVIVRLAQEIRSGASDGRFFVPQTIFRPANFERNLGLIGD